MTQSIDLLLDDGSDDAVRAEWELLRAAELPSAWRPEPSGSHCPHITLGRGYEVEHLGPAIAMLARQERPAEHQVQITQCRWDGEAKRDWPL